MEEVNVKLSQEISGIAQDCERDTFWPLLKANTSRGIHDNCTTTHICFSLVFQLCIMWTDSVLVYIWSFWLHQMLGKVFFCSVILNAFSFLKAVKMWFKIIRVKPTLLVANFDSYFCYQFRSVFKHVFYKWKGWCTCNMFLKYFILYKVFQSLKFMLSSYGIQSTFCMWTSIFSWNLLCLQTLHSKRELQTLISWLWA